MSDAERRVSGRETYDALIANLNCGPARDDVELARDAMDDAADAIRDLRAERDALAGLAREARDALDAIANKEGTDRWLLACEIDAALAAQEKP